MKKAKVQIGSTYVVKVSGKLTRVRIVRESPYGGWDGLNLATQRAVHIRSAARPPASSLLRSLRGGGLPPRRMPAMGWA